MPTDHWKVCKLYETNIADQWSSSVKVIKDLVFYRSISFLKDWGSVIVWFLNFRHIIHSFNKPTMCHPFSVGLFVIC